VTASGKVPKVNSPVAHKIYDSHRHNSLSGNIYYIVH
jgi:hypothetical protein